MRLKIILLLSPIICFAQLSAKVDSLYQQLNSQKGIEARNIGYDGHESEVYQMYAKLDSIATDDEALYMARNGNEVVKGYLSNVLVDRKSKHLATLFSDYIKNDAEVHIHSGCTGNESSIAGELYGYIFYQNQKIENVKYFTRDHPIDSLKRYGMDYETKWAKPEVDSLLTILNKTALTNDNVLPVTLRHIFALNQFKFENYDRIKFFAYKYPEVEILATLAAYRNKKDLPLLHQNIGKAYIAISKFPDKSFIPELKERIENGCRNEYYFLDAVAAFRTKDAEELQLMVVDWFETLKKKNNGFWMGGGEQYDHFYECLEKQDCSYTDDFLLKLWLDRKFISISFFDKIKDKHYNEILKGFINPIPINITNPIPTNILYNDDVVWEKYKADFEEADGYWCPVILKYLKNNSSQNKDKSIDLDKIKCQERT